MENSASEKIDVKEALEKLKIDRVCDERCAICHSPFILEIHELKNRGVRQIDIIDEMKAKHNFAISPASLSRHFSNYFARQLEITSKVINQSLINEATAQSVHLQKTIALIDLAFESLEKRMRLYSFVPDVSDLEKLMKLRYQVLTGNDEIDKDIMAVFQKATDKYGVSLNQGVLFSVPRADVKRGEPSE